MQWEHLTSTQFAQAVQDDHAYDDEHGDHDHRDADAPASGLKCPGGQIVHRRSSGRARLVRMRPRTSTRIV